MALLHGPPLSRLSTANVNPEARNVSGGRGRSLDPPPVS